MIPNCSVSKTLTGKVEGVYILPTELQGVSERHLFEASTSSLIHGPIKSL